MANSCLMGNMAKRRAKKGTGSIFKTGGTWAYRYTENGAKKFLSFPTKMAAEKARMMVTLRLQAGKPGVEQEPGDVPLIGALVDDWLLSRAKKASLAEDKIRWRKHLHARVAGKRVTDVAPQDVARMVDEMHAAEMDPATIERIVYTLSAFYRYCRTTLKVPGVTIGNPAREYLAGLDKDTRKDLRSQYDPSSTPFLENPDDVYRIYAGLTAPLNIAYVLSAKAGLRPGEVLALEWSDVDLDRGIAKVQRNIRAGKVSQTTKGGKARLVSLTPWLVAELRKWRGKNPTSTIVVRSAKYRFKEVHVWSRSVGNALAELLPKLGLPVLTFYQAGRHSYASHWAMKGLDLYRLCKQMGHASIETTQRYAHLTAGLPADLLAQLDAPAA